MSFVSIFYIASAALFIMGLKMMGKTESARAGNQVSAVGMLLAVGASLFEAGLDYKLILIGLVIGTAIGLYSALKIQMTEMPEMVALFNGSGGLASLLLGWAEFSNNPLMAQSSTTAAAAGALAIVIGGVTFTGSIIAWAKLSGRIDSGATAIPARNFINIVLVSAMLAGAVLYSIPQEHLSHEICLYIILGVSLIIGIVGVLPIGGADMPVVISFLNSCSGLAACAAGFAISNNILIVAGCLVGASGLILTNIMCKAMNRTFINVMYGSFSASGSGKFADKNDATALSPSDAYYVLEAASNVVFVPGYGMAVAQAQHAVRDLANVLEDNGCEVKFAIHPVAGRMPGHMNVLLAEADISYDNLIEMDDINPAMEEVDVCIVLGANDVVNPVARDDEDSIIYGMPIIEADRAKQVFVIKRSLSPGFAGIDNPLFYNDNSSMLFGDAKGIVEQLVEEFK